MDNLIEELRAAHNASGNATKPFNEQEAVNEYVLSWFRGENLPRPSTVLIFLCWAAFYPTIQALRYTFWKVVATLAIVEAPQATLRHDSNRHDVDKGDESKIVVSEERAYTRSLRAALRYLYRIGGPLAYFRGLSISMAYYCVFLILSLALGGLETILKLRDPVSFEIKEPGTKLERISFRLMENVDSIIMAVILVHFATAFTHIVITKPTLRFWLQRLPPFRSTIARALPATVVYMLAYILTFSMPYTLHIAFGIDDHSLKKAAANSTIGTTPADLIAQAATEASSLAVANATAENTTLADAISAAKNTPSIPWTPAQKAIAVAIWLLAQASRFGLLVPAGVALTRVQAALLPEDDETIVPMDRAFGTAGSAAPGILGTPVALSLRAAWRSFGRADKRRIYLLYAKFIAVEVVVRAVFGLALGWKEVWPELSTWNPSLFVV